MVTNDTISENCIGTRSNCAVCGSADAVRYGMPGDLPSVCTCDDCAPAGGQPAREWFRTEVRDE